MNRTATGIVIATLVLYAWGFLYWGFGPYREAIWKQASDDVAAGQALREHFPEDGTWYVPGFGHDQQTIEQRFTAGPVAFVHMLSVSGRNLAEPSIIIQGFVLNLVFVALLALLLRQIGHALPRYVDRVKLVTIAGLAATVLIDFGDAVWWQVDWSWKLYQGFYSFSAWLVVGLILGAIIRPAPATDTQEAATE